MPSHDELEEILERYGIIPAYDGMTVKI